MSSSRHPIALRLEQWVDDPTRLLATVMLLPLVDGIFPALVLAGAVDTVAGVLQVGVLVFGGSATLAVVLAEMNGDRRDRATAVLLVGIPLVVLAGVEAALAPTIAALVDLETFARFAAIVVAAIAAKTASARVGELLPRPAVVVGLGAVASVDPTATVSLVVDPSAVAHGVAAGLVGVGFALGVALLGPRLRAAVAVDRFRFGSAVALGLLALSILGLPFGRAPLAVVALTALFTYDPGGSRGAEEGGAHTDELQTGDGVEGERPAESRTEAGTTAASDAPPVADGGDPAAETAAETARDCEGGTVAGDTDTVAGDIDGGRPPWL